MRKSGRRGSAVGKIPCSLRFPESTILSIKPEQNRRANRLSLVLLCTVGSASLICMALCLYAVPRLIESAYHGNSLAIFNRMITGQALHPVGDYLKAWNRIRWWLLADLVLLGLVTILILRPEFRRLVWGTDSSGLTEETQAGSGVRRGHILALAGYLLLAIFFTLPASLSPSRALLGDGADNYLHSWLVWNFAHSIIHGHTPFH